MLQPQDPSAFLKAMLKIPDVNPHTSKQESKQSTPQPAATVSQKDQPLNPPPLVQQLFDVCIYRLYHIMPIYCLTVLRKDVYALFSAPDKRNRKKRKQIQSGTAHNC